MKDTNKFYGGSNTFQLENKPLAGQTELNYNYDAYDSTNVYYHGDGGGVSYLYHGGFIKLGIHSSLIIQTHYGDGGGKGKGYE